MISFHTSLPPLLEQELARILRRYRLVRLLRAGARLILFLILLFAVLAAVWLAGAPVSPLALSTVFILSALAVSCYVFLPLVRRPITLRDIARHIDQDHPELQDRILSAVSLTDGPGDGGSAWMVEHFLAETQQQVKGVPLDSFMNPRELQWLLGLIVVCIFAGLGGLMTAGVKLGYLRSDSGGIFARGAVEFHVEPGNATVQPGDNQVIWVTSPDTESTRFIYWEQNGVEERAVLLPSSSPDVTYHTFYAVRDTVRYRVRVAEVESASFEIQVNEPPAVESIQLEYVYPDYLEMEAKVVPFGGEIAAVEGTQVTVRVAANKEIGSAQLVREDGGAIPLVRGEDNRWHTSFELDLPDRYHVALVDTAGEENVDPETYPIRVVPDNPPEIQVRFPRGDSEVLALEEVPLAFTLKDDFGIDAYGIEYTVAGREPIRLALNAGGDLLQQITESHLLALEEVGVSSGDLITWSVWAHDRKPDRSEYEISGDPFFLEVRPYVLRFREQVSQGGQAGEASVDDDQRMVVIAIYNLRKSAMGLGETSYDEQVSRIVEAQVAVREGVTENLGRVTGNEKAIAEAAVEAMEAVETALTGAAWPNPEAELGDALQEAQRAMHLLMRLEPELRQVMRTEGQGGGGGGGAGQPEIDELEMARRKDYQEEARTGGEDVEAQEALRKSLDDLARRQEILNDDLGKLLSEEEKAAEALERKRQLERLQEEQARQLERLDELASQLASSAMDAAQRQEAAKELQEARRNMERSMEAARGEQLQQARSAGSRAAQNLADAESGLDQLTREGARQRFAALEEKLQSLGERQAGIQDETSAMKEAQAAPGLDGQQALEERAAALKTEKEAVAGEARELIEEAGGLSDQLRENQELLSRKLGDWARRTSREGVVQDMEESLDWVDSGAWDALEVVEGQVKRKLDAAATSLEALREFVPGNRDDDMERALAMLRSMDGMELPGADGSEDSENGGPSGDTSDSGDEGPQASRQPGDGESPGESGPGGTQPAGENQEGASPGEQPGTSSGGQPGEGRGTGESPEGESQQASASPDGRAGQAEGTAGEGTPGNASGSGATEGAIGPQASQSGGGGGATSLEDLFGEGGRDWRPTLRDAASLLPRESEIRTTLEQVEMDLGRLEREYNRNRQLPPTEEFEQVVRRPLMDSISTLDELVRAKSAREAQWLEDEGAIPSQYVDRVAEYFRILADGPEEP